ncbi:MAG: HD domain-containing protein [Candidatus Eisenbacteria sp.]|nr:HD domain-containing protein [Candidatus Eisenbacteria bacterium]
MVLYLSGTEIEAVKDSTALLAMVVWVGAAAVTSLTVSSCIVAVPLSVDLGSTIRSTWWRSFRWLIPQLLWITLGAFVLAILYAHQLWIPFAIVYASELCATRLGAAIMRLRALLAQTVEVLRTILIKTAPHLEAETNRIQDLAVKLADAVRLNPFERAAMAKAIPLLNMGYVGVEKHLLVETPEWEKDDRERMQGHPMRGARILSKAHHLKDAARLVAMHHERIDGSGYPRGLEGPEIPMGARILGTVEAYVGMTSERPHREPLTASDAIRELHRDHHDSRVVTELARIEGLPSEMPAEATSATSTKPSQSWWREKRRQLRELIYYPPPPDLKKQPTHSRWVAHAFFLPAPILFIVLFATSADTLARIDSHGALWLALILASAILAPVFLRRGATLSAVMGSLVAATLLLPPAQVLAYCLVAGTILGAWEIGRRRLPTSGPSLVAGTVAATTVYHLLQAQPGTHMLFGSPSGPVFAIPAIAAALAFGIAATGTASILEGATQRLTPSRVMMGSYLPFLPETLLYLFGGIVMAAMYSLFGPAGAALALIYPLLDLHFDIWHQNQLQKSYTELLEAEAAAIDEKDPYTRGHSQRVSEFAVAVAREMQLTEGKVNLVEEGAFEHDLGKIAWEGGMLMRPDVLTDDEYGLMLRHPAEGAEIAAKMGAPQAVIDMIYHHHEHHDGSGFPEGLAAEKVPLGARILHVVDAFDAMTSGRPYKDDASPDEAAGEIRRCAGTDFDPEVVAAFERAYRKGRIAAANGKPHTADRVPLPAQESAGVLS